MICWFWRRFVLKEVRRVLVRGDLRVGAVVTVAKVGDDVCCMFDDTSVSCCVLTGLRSTGSLRTAELR